MELEHYNLMPPLRLSKKGIFYHQGKPLTDAEKAQIFYYHALEVNPAQISRITHRDRKTIDKYVDIFENTNSPFSKPEKLHLSYQGIHTKPERLDFFFQLVSRCPGLTLEGMKIRYLLFFDQLISKSMIFYILRIHLKFSFKKISPIEWARTQEDVIKEHDEFFFFFHSKFSKKC